MRQVWYIMLCLTREVYYEKADNVNWASCSFPQHYVGGGKAI